MVLTIRTTPPAIRQNANVAAAQVNAPASTDVSAQYVGAISLTREMVSEPAE
jgi:hypothetical protein